VSGAATVAEAYEIKKLVKSSEGRIPRGFSRFIVSGNIRPMRTTWDDSGVQYLKDRYTKPIVDLDKLPPNRRAQSLLPKVVISGMAKRPVAFYDENGEYVAGKSTVLVYEPCDEISLAQIAVILNSQLAALLYRAFYASLALAGGYLRFGPPQISNFPVPKLAPRCSRNHDHEECGARHMASERVVSAYDHAFRGRLLMTK
jgi:hypothetical protein